VIRVAMHWEMLAILPAYRVLKYMILQYHTKKY
jgi:hypothetical protein